MCLAIPGKILGIEGQIAKVDFGGVQRKVNISLLENVNVGEYVIVHAGYAIQVLDEQSAKESLATFQKIFGYLEGGD